MIKKIIKKLVLLAVLGWFLFCGAVYFYPQMFFYHPDSNKSSVENANINHFTAKEVIYVSADGTELYGWYVAPKNKNKLSVYFHGNSRNIEAFYHKLIPLTEAGYGVLMAEYRGFGGIKGEEKT